MDIELEQLKRDIENKEAAQADTELEQTNHSFSDTIESRFIKNNLEQMYLRSINGKADKSHSFILWEIYIERTLKGFIRHGDLEKAICTLPKQREQMIDLESNDWSRNQMIDLEIPKIYACNCSRWISVNYYNRIY